MTSPRHAQLNIHAALPVLQSVRVIVDTLSRHSTFNINLTLFEPRIC